MSTIATTHDGDGYSVYDAGRDDTLPCIVTCGVCQRSWDDSIVTGMTPAPSARCPFEYFHNGEDVPDDWPVQPVELDGRRQ